MNRRDLVISTFACAVGLSTPSRIAGQKKTIKPNLAELAEGKGFKVFNRSLSSLTDGARKGVRLSENPGDGVAYLQGIEFTNGTLELSVFVGDAKEPSLVVDQLSERKKGLVGLWVGNNSSGDFANLKIVPA